MNHVREENIWLSGRVEIYTMMQCKVTYKMDLIEKTMMHTDYDNFFFFLTYLFI